jgi:hypothetical protein
MNAPPPEEKKRWANKFDKNARRRPIEPLWSSFPELRVRLARQRCDMSSCENSSQIADQSTNVDLEYLPLIK